MKRLILIALALVLFTGSAQAASLGKSTGFFLTMYGTYLNMFGVQHYSFEHSGDKDESIIMPINKHCSLYIHQQGGEMTKLEVVSSEDDGSEDRTSDIIGCFMGAMMLIDLSMPAEDVIKNLNEITSTTDAVIINGISYRFVTGQPFTSIVALEITPAD